MDTNNASPPPVPEPAPIQPQESEVNIANKQNEDKQCKILI